MDELIHSNHESNCTEHTDKKRVMKFVGFTLWVNAENLVTHSLSTSAMPFGCISVCMPFRVHPWFKFFSRLIELEP